MANQMAIGDYLDVVVEPRYDSAIYLSTGSTLLTFFANPIGQGVGIFQVGGGTAPKTLADTNMDLSGQLPGGYNFKLLGFRVMYGWNMSTQDMQIVLNAGVFTFTIGSKPFLRTALRNIPAGNGPVGTTATINTNGWPMLSNSYSIAKKPLDLLQTQNFQATITFPGVAPVSTTVGALSQQVAGLPITVMLDGFLYRPVQ